MDVSHPYRVHRYDGCYSHHIDRDEAIKVAQIIYDAEKAVAVVCNLGYPDSVSVQEHFSLTAGQVIWADGEMIQPPIPFKSFHYE